MKNGRSAHECAPRSSSSTATRRTDVPDILHRIGTSATPEKVFAALTTIDGLRRWWVSSATGDAKKGGRIDFGFCDMQVVAAEPGQRVQWRCVRGPAEWVDTEVTFRLRKDSETFVL